MLSSPRLSSRQPFALSIFFAFLLLLGLLLPREALAQSLEIQQLVQRAEQLKLHEQRQWQLLLHYEKKRFGGVESPVIGDFFFLAEDGRTNPKAEMAATLAALIENPMIKEREESARCVFVARYQWLQEQLGFDPQYLAGNSCPRYQKWLKGLKPQRAYLVFPDAYPNGPSSMFGHTLLRVDGDGQSGLLAYAINYAADADADTALFYAIKGLTGGYPGSYGIYPYYEKVKEYASAENRDIWEYPLNITEPELVRLMAHLWELRGVKFPYLFLSRNCSFELLALLEVARPSLRLQDQFGSHTIPADTIRAMAKAPDLLGPPEFRASNGRILKHQLGQLTAEQRRCVYRLGMGLTTPKDACVAAQPPMVQARLLETAQGFLYYGFKSGRFERKEMAPRSIKILSARSRLAAKDVYKPVPQPAVSPDYGHGTLRLAVGYAGEKHRIGGARQNSDAFTLRLRPAFHDQLDSSLGYTPGAQINFLDARLSYEPSESRLKLDELQVINIMSLSERDAFFKPIAWQVGTGLRRSPLQPLFGDNPADLGAYLQGGPGLAYGDLNSLAVYGFGLVSLDAENDLDSGYRLALGGNVGLRYERAGQWNGLLEIGQLEGQWGQGGQHRWFKAAAQKHFNRHYGLRASVQRNRFAGEYWTHFEIALQRYFD